MTLRRKIAFAVPLMLALSACGDDAEVAVEDDGREASGEVLEGTISDAMLPVDQVRSQAPLVAQEEETATSGPAPAAEPAPVATPEPALEPAEPDGE